MRLVWMTLMLCWVTFVGGAYSTLLIPYTRLPASASRHLYPGDPGDGWFELKGSQVDAEETTWLMSELGRRRELYVYSYLGTLTSSRCTSTSRS